MEPIVALLISLLPKQIAAIEYLKLVPAAMGLVKELVAEVQRVIGYLRQPKIPKTEEQLKVLDHAIASLSTDPYWQQEEPAK
jgi:hypothetical protein